MKRVIRRLSRQGYKHIAKPLLFREHPDKAHAHMIIAARGLQKARLTGVLNVWRYQSPRLEQELLGIRFKIRFCGSPNTFVNALSLVTIQTLSIC